MKKLKGIWLVSVSVLMAIGLLSLFWESAIQPVSANNVAQPMATGLEIARDNVASANPGETITYTHLLTNTGDVTDVVAIAVSSAPGFLATVQPIEVALNPGASAVVTATVTITQWAAADLMGVTVVTAASSNDNTLIVSATNTTTVKTVPGIAITPGSMHNVDPGQSAIYTHIITNTGNAPDNITLSKNSSQGFITTINPAMILLAQGENAIITVTVTPPANTLAGLVDATAVTATSGIDNALSVSATNTTTINLVAGLAVEPDRQSQNANPDSQVTYSYAITNTGNSADTYAFTTSSNQGYEVNLSANQLSLLVNANGVLTLTLAIPADAAANTIDETILTIASGNNPALTTPVTSVTEINSISGLLINPNNSGWAYPGETVVYTHTVTNTGNRTETVSLAAGSDQDWVTEVQPNSLILPRNVSRVVTLTVAIPTGVVEGVIDTTVITASIGQQPKATANNATTIRYRKTFLPVAVRPANWEMVGNNWSAGEASLSFAVCSTDRNKIIAGGFGSGAKVWILNGTSWAAAANVPTGFNVTAVVMNQACDKAYVSLYDQGIWQGLRNGTTWTWTQLGGSEVKLARTLALAGDMLFAGGEFGIRFWGSNAWQFTNGVETAQPVMHIFAANPADNNSTLYATQWLNGKIYRALGGSPSLWSLLPLPDLPDTLARVVLGTSTNVMFVGTQSASYQLVGGNWVSIAVPAGLRSAVINGDTAYLGYSLNSGVYKLQGNSLTPIDAGWSSKPDYVYGLALVGGQLYAATTTGVWVYQQP